jgi:hypothetical protein
MSDIILWLTSLNTRRTFTAPSTGALIGSEPGIKRHLKATHRVPWQEHMTDLRKLKVTETSKPKPKPSKAEQAWRGAVKRLKEIGDEMGWVWDWS